MAISYVGGKTAVFVGATTAPAAISLTDLTGGLAAAPIAGDLVVLTYATGAVADRAIGVTTAGYTEVSELYANGTTNDTNLSVSYKIMGGSPDTNVALSATGNAADAGSVTIQVFRGVDPTTPMDVAATTATGTATGRPNPAAITPVTAGALVVACGGASAATGAVFVGTGLTNFRTATSPDTQDAMSGMGYSTWASGALDPAAWTGGTTGAADSWAAVTLALRPAPTPTNVPVTAATQTLAGQATTVNAKRNVAVTAAALACSGQAVAVRIVTLVAVTAAALATAGQAIVVNKSRIVAVSAGIVACAGQAIIVNARRMVAVTAVPVTYVGQAIAAAAAAMAAQLLRLRLGQGLR